MSSDEAEPSASGKGVRGAGAGEEAGSLTNQEQGKSQDVNAEQMAAPGEGDIASAVKGGASTQAGGGKGEKGQETDLDRKKAEQAPGREQMKQEQKDEVNVGGVLSQRGGPAEPSDNQNLGK